MFQCVYYWFAFSEEVSIKTKRIINKNVYYNSNIIIIIELNTLTGGDSMFDKS